jgi:AP2 domain
MKELPLGHKMYALIDDEDVGRCLQFSWFIARKTNTNYARTKFRKSDGGGSIMLHNFIMEAYNGEQYDHIDKNGLNNQKSNLRRCTQSLNRASALSPGSSSGYRGVRFRRGAWEVELNTKVKGYYLGRFDNVIDAARAYDRKALELFGEFATLNFPRGDIPLPTVVLSSTTVPCITTPT